MIEVTLRVLFSLTVVLFLMWGLARLVRRPLGARGAGALAVLTRQPLGRSCSIAVIKVDDRALVVGITEAHVTLLTETHLAAFERPQPTPSSASDEDEDVLSSPVRGPLSGSILSPATWTHAVEFVRNRTSRQR